MARALRNILWLLAICGAWSITGCSAINGTLGFNAINSVDVAASEGISAIIEPGGSIRDKEVIEAANAHKIALYFSGKRHFWH